MDRGVNKPLKLKKKKRRRSTKFLSCSVLKVSNLGFYISVCDPVLVNFCVLCKV